MTEAEKILMNLSPEEREAVLTILKEQANSGSSQSLADLYSDDYDEIPVDIDTFLESPTYLGNSTNNGTAIYPYWRNAYREIINNDKVECAFSGSIGCGKAGRLDSNLVGPNGYFKMRDVKVGDLVAGQDGKFYHVTSIWPQGKIPIYRITFSDHTYVECSIDHLWNIRRTDRQSKKQPYPNPSYVYETKSVRWLLQQDLKIGRGRVDKKGHKLEQNKFAIPVTLPVQFNNDYDFVIPPYVMGILLSDGGLSSDSVKVSIYEEDVRDRVNDLLEPIGCYLKLSSPSDKHEGLGDFSINSKTSGYNPVIREIKKLNLNVKSVDKHIPKEYLLSNIENRIELLRGLVDGDGYIEPARYMYSTSSKQLYEDFCFLVYSLGGTVNVTDGKEAYRYLPDGTKKKSEYLNYEFTFHMPKAIRAFHSDKHTKRFGKGTHYHEMEYRFIESIEPAGEAECQCITVDNPESLYLMDNFTVTHNTTAAIYLMSYFVYKLMCLKNIRQYFGLEGNGPVCIAFLNNTIQLSKGVAYDKFMSTVSTSPWFLERGEVRGTVNIRYKPHKNIEFVLGSSADQIIGRDIFCLTGDTKIKTKNGTFTIGSLENKEVYVETVDNDGNITYSDKPCIIRRTKTVAAVRIITLSTKETIRCTYNHKFLMVDMTYKEAKDLNPQDKLFTPHDSKGIEVINVTMASYDQKIPVYDVINSEPYHNFIVDAGNGTLVVSHNCAIQDEVNFCLDANTPIVTTKGVKSLVDVSPSDKLFSYDMDNHKLRRSLSDGGMPTAYVNEYVELKLMDGTTLRCSKNHRFLLSNGEYKQACDLTEDDDLMELSPYGYVYITTNKINGKRYIGQHKGLFDSSYLGSGDVLWLAIQKYGRKAFETEVIEYCYNASELDEKENYWLSHYNAAKSDKFYNITNYQYPITSNCVVMHKGGHMKRVPANDIQKHLDDGYELGIDPSMNHHTGKCYVIRDGCMKLVPLAERDNYVDAGWEVFSPNRGKVVINNGAMLRYIAAAYLSSYIKEGWISTNNCAGLCCIYPPGSKSYKRVTVSEALQLIKQGYTYNDGTKTAQIIEEALANEN